MIYVLFLWSVCLALGYAVLRSRFPSEPKIQIKYPVRKRMV